MPTQNRNPTSDISAAGTWSGTAGTRYTLVDDYPTSTGDVLIHGTTAGNINFGFSAFSIPSIATSISVQVLYFDDKNGTQASNIGGRLRVGGTFYNATTHNPANGVATQRTDNFATNPRTGTAWTVNDINGVGSNALDAFGFISTDASPTVDIYSCQLQVTYTASYTIVADTVVFNENGVDALLEKNSNVIADAGSFAVTGIDATLTKTVPAKIIVADKGTFDVSGIDNTLALAKKIIASFGSFSESFKDAELSATRKLSANPSSFSGTYNPAGLSAVRIVVANSSSFAVDGKATGLLTTRTIIAAPSSFSLDGKTIELDIAKKMTATSTSFAVDGKNISFSATRKLTAATRSFAVSGNEVSFPNSRTIVAHSGIFALGVNDADIKVSKKLTASARSFAVAGPAVTFKIISPLVANVYSAILSGKNATLKVGRKMSVVPGSFGYLGGAAIFNIKTDYRIFANRGSFVVSSIDTLLVKTTIMPVSSKTFTLTGNGALTKLGRAIQASSTSLVLTGNNADFIYVQGRIIDFYDGTQWIEGKVKTWNGTQWVGNLKYWDGIEWS